MKNWKNFTFVGILAIYVFAFAFGCSGNKLSGKWETNVNTDIGPVIEFSGNNFTFLYKDGRQRRYGTYTIYGNRIEFVFENGHTTNESFARTGNNTISINTFLYTRKK